jgi:glutamate 5-kinase
MKDGEHSVAWRARLREARRLVVKIGSRVLVDPAGKPEIRRIRGLVGQLAAARRGGCEIVVVSSGAIGTGMQALGMRTRPTSIPDLQMAAAVGQSRLMALYDKLFSKQGLLAGQVLLTHDDLKDRVRHLNARNTMMNFLRHGIVPVVNENDAVAVDEIKFGDNDLLASLVALLIDAQALVLLTTVDGFRAPLGATRTRRVPFLPGVDEDVLAHAVGKGSPLSTGGMASKLQSAAVVVGSGIPVVIADGRRKGCLSRVMAGGDEGTLIASPAVAADGSLPRRKLWIAYFHKPAGNLVIDDGARDALVRKGRSLLPIGVRDVQGSFGQGAVVNVVSSSGNVIARGLADYSSDEVRRIMGRKTAEIAAILGYRDYDAVIHRDNMVVLDKGATA